MQPCFAYQKHTLIEDTNKALVFHRRQQSEPHDALLYHKKKLQVVLSQARVMLPHGRARAELLHGRWGQAPRDLIGAELLMAFPGLRSSMAEVLPIRREQSWMPYSASSPLLLFSLLHSIFFKKLSDVHLIDLEFFQKRTASHDLNSRNPDPSFLVRFLKDFSIPPVTFN
jgi:hypothetical protein